MLAPTHFKPGAMPTLVVGMPEAAETMALMVLAVMATTSAAMAPGRIFDRR